MRDEILNIVSDVLQDFDEGVGIQEIAKRYNVHHTTISRILTNVYKERIDIVNSKKPLNDPIDLVICSHFGCGKHLTRQERLYGDSCLSHQEEKNIIQIVDKVIKFK